MRGYLKDPDSGWEPLRAATEPLVRATAVRVGAAAIEQDVVDDVLPRVAMACAGYDPERASWSKWVTVIARNAAINLLRRRAGQDTAEDRPAEDERDASYLADDVLTYVPFRLPRVALARVVDAWVRSGGVPTDAAVEDVTAVLDEQAGSWRRHGRPADVVAALFALIRAARTLQADRERLLRAVGLHTGVDPVTVLRQRIGRAATAEVLLLFGGTRLRLPAPASFSALVRRRR